MPKPRLNFWLVAILVLALLIRIYRLGSLPYGTHVDEASWGYNAYSVLETGKDEHGAKWPLVFQAFGDQKLPIFTYAVVPFVNLFGLSNLAVRIPAALIGTASVYLIYLLVKKWGLAEKYRLTAALIMAVSPWPIWLSRVFSFDSTFGLFFYLIALINALSYWQKPRLKYLVLTALFLGITWYCYVAYRLVSVITLLLIWGLSFKKTRAFAKESLLYGTVFLLTVAPLLSLWLTGTGTSRFGQVMSTPLLGMTLEINENRFFCQQHFPALFCQAIENKGLSYLQALTHRYVKAFSPNYLFIEGEPNYPFLNVAHYGLWPLILLPFYFVGFGHLIYQLIKGKGKKQQWLLLGGLIFAPSAALLVNDPQKVRLSAWLPYVLLLIVSGIQQVEQFCRPKYRQLFISLVQLLLITSAFLFAFNFFFIHLSKNSFHYQNQVIDLMKQLRKVPNKTQVFIQGIDEAIIYYAFVNKVDPLVYQTKVKREVPDEIGFSHATDLNNIHVTTQELTAIYCQFKKVDSPGYT